MISRSTIGPIEFIGDKNDIELVEPAWISISRKGGFESQAAKFGCPLRTRKRCSLIDQFRARTNTGVKDKLFDCLKNDHIGPRDS